MSMFPEGFDMGSLMAQAQAMQAQLQQAQADRAAARGEGTAGGDLVKVTLTGTGQLEAVVIKPEAVDMDDLEGLGDLIVAAARDAQTKADALAAASMPAMPPGMGF